jgi:hypothetical protein
MKDMIFLHDGGSDCRGITSLFSMFFSVFYNEVHLKNNQSQTFAGISRRQIFVGFYATVNL